LYRNRSSCFILNTFVLLAALALAAGRVYADDAASGAETQVYVTNSGTRYHRGDCYSLARSRIAVTLGDAVRSGYEPCSICKPPALERGGVPEAVSPQAALYRVNRARDPLSGDEGLGTYAAADLRLMTEADVIGHVDGDTVRVRVETGGLPAELGVVEIVRLIGVDTPETVHPSRPVERFGEAASAFTQAALLNTRVYLAFDWDLRDRYGRLLAYVYTSNGECFNAALIREGYASAYTRYAFQFMDEFRALEQEARARKRGLWGD
jgi:micrococcal nuclease